MRWFLRIAAAAAVLGAVIALLVPLQLGAADRSGVAIGCGSVLSPDDSVAAREDAWNEGQHRLVGPQFVKTEYVVDCAGKRASRGRAALLVATLGIASFAAVLVAERISAAARRPRAVNQPRRH